MKRMDFIHRLLALGGLSFIAGNNIKTKQYRKFYLLQCFVRGFQYYEGPSWISQMREGELLELVREPDNEYDPAAIALHWHNRKIGFIPAEENEMLSKLLDIGLPALIAEISFLEPQAASWEKVFISVYLLNEIQSSEQVPSVAVSLTQLETPHYRTLHIED
jgi:hypothetical protein